MTMIAIVRSPGCDPLVTPEWLALFALDLTVQLTRDLALAWGLDARTIVVDPHVWPSFESAPPSSYVLEFVGAMPPEDAADAAFHIEDAQGRVRAPIATIGYSLDDVSLSASHEACEAVCDPTTTTWIEMPSGAFTMREVCDAVQSEGYYVRAHGCLMSDFLYPSWFDAEGRPPFDALDTLTAPFTRRALGYLILRSATGLRSQDPPGARLRRRALAALRGGR